MTTLPATTEEQTVLPAPAAVLPPRISAGLTAGDVWRIIRRHLGLLVLVWVLVMVLTAAGTYIWLKYWPSWTATAYIRVESPLPERPFGAWEDRMLAKDQIERALRDQAMMIKSITVLQRAIEDDRIRRLTSWWSREVGADPTEALLTLQEDLVASPLRDSTIIQVRYSTRNPDDAPIIVNTVVEHYFNRLAELYRDRFREERDRYQQELADAQRELQAKIQEIVNYQTTEANIPGITQQMTVVTDRLMRLNAMLTEAKARQEQLRAVYEMYSKGGIESMPITPEIMAAVESDPKIMQLESRRTALLEQKEALLDKFGEKHRAVRDIDARIEAIEEQLNQIRLQKIDEYKRMQFERIRTEYLAAVDQVAQLSQDYEEAVAAQLDLDRKRAYLERLMEERDRAQERYDEIKKYLDQLNIIAGKQRAVRIIWMQQATRPLERSLPRWEVNLPAGAVLGLLLAVGIIMLVEFMDTSVRTPRDVIRHGAMPVLGVVPVLDDEDVRIDNIELATRVAPRSMVAECFRQIRTNLSFSCPPEQQSTVMVTSAQPGEGKTAVSVNLAVTNAQSGKRILLVDANFRRPALFRAFPQLKQEGLSNLLVGQGSLDDLVNSTEIENLHILSAGPTPPNPAELLGSSYFKAFLTEAASKYDQVILDAPPALLVSDAMVMATAVDGVLIVCRAGVTSRGALRRLRDSLDRIGARVLGVVLNAVETQAGGYYRDLYRAYYDYDEQGTTVVASLPGADSQSNPPAST